MAVSGGLLGPVTATAAPMNIAWQACGESVAGDPLECATLDVPLDYRHPAGASTSLGLTRLRLPTASDAVVFVNGGGPGVPGDSLLRNGPSPVPPAVSEHFTIVAIDPRGLPASTALTCVNPAETARITAAITAAPSSLREIRRTYRTMQGIGSACAAARDPLTRHMGSVANAYDMDYVRSALSQPVLNYIGVSYGTFLGAVYSHLFPTRVGRMVLGSVVPPNRDWISLVRMQVRGFEMAINQWAATCRTRATCPFRHGDPLDRLVSLIDRLNARPAPLILGEFSGQSLVLSLRGEAFLGSPAAQTDATVRFAQRKARHTRDGNAPVTGILEAMTGVQWATRCNDWPDAREDFAGYMDRRQDWDRTFPVFGAALAPLSVPCTDWPGAPQKPMMLTQATNAVPLLVAGLHDPATPLFGAKALERTFRQARLVTWPGWGHGALESGDCDAIVAAYLVDGTLPSQGDRCPVVAS